MKHKLLGVALAFSLLCMFATETQAQQVYKKLAQTGFQFLSLQTDARSAAMGGAFTGMAGGSLALFHNPSSMGWFDNTVDFHANRLTWIADINYLSGSVAFNPAGGRFGVFGLSLVSVDYGEMQGTVIDETAPAGFRDTEMIQPSAFSVGLGYANALSNRFAVGGQIKYATQNLGESIIPIEEQDASAGTTTKEYKLGTLAYDFGTTYQTGFQSLVLAMSVRNFSPEIKYEAEAFELPLTFHVGATMNVFDVLNMPDNQSLMLSFDALHPRSYPEYTRLGAEYTFMDLVALRGGYTFGHEEYGLSLGFGLQFSGVGLDYAYTPFDTFANVSRISVHASF